ncbi:MAG: hypothetical protein Q9168_002106 [Polycauliona sp. 1 TL-2023]
MPVRELSNGWHILEEDDQDARNLPLAQQTTTLAPQKDTMRYPAHEQNKPNTEDGVLETTQSAQRPKGKKRKAEVIELSSGDEIDDPSPALQHTVNKPFQVPPAPRPSTPRQERLWQKACLEDLRQFRASRSTPRVRKPRTETASARMVRLVERTLAQMEESREHRRKLKEETRAYNKSLKERLEAYERELAIKSEERGKRFPVECVERREKWMLELEERRRQVALDLERGRRELIPGLEARSLQIAAHLAELGKELAADIAERRRRLLPEMEEMNRRRAADLLEQREQIAADLAEQREQLVADLIT